MDEQRTECEATQQNPNTHNTAQSERTVNHMNTNATTNSLQYRQGDVLFSAIPSIPKGRQTKRNDGAVAYGEVTGHAHCVMTPETAEVVEIGGGIFVKVSERGIAIEKDIARLLPDVQVIADDPTESVKRRDSARNLLAALPQAGTVFLHGTLTERQERPVPSRDEDRHLPVALIPGMHEVEIQREWSPEAIRNVTD